MQFSCRRGWSGLISFPLPPPPYLLPYRRKLWNLWTIHQLVRGFDVVGPSLRDGDAFSGRKIARFHGFLASLFTQTGFRRSSGTWNIFSKRNSPGSVKNSILNQGHSLIVEFEKWHGSRRSIDGIISKFNVIRIKMLGVQIETKWKEKMVNLDRLVDTS